jgi:hypothetical protein
MECVLVLAGLVVTGRIGFKGLTIDGGGGDDDKGGYSGGGRAVTHNHGLIDLLGKHDE